MKNTDTEILEIVELANGEIALRRPDTQTEPLVSIRFSVESRHFLGNIRPLVAKAMIEAGIQAVQDLREPNWDEIEEDDEELEEMLEQELEQLANSKPVRKSVLH
ncbi:MAG TPA: hypothetical protein PK129_10670 [Cellvibrionaceae bacterium]|nr:hypothetical protein [Cellvibrionaceae bacterium]